MKEEYEERKEKQAETEKGENQNIKTSRNSKIPFTDMENVNK